jgi:hypothetical protein
MITKLKTHEGISVLKVFHDIGIKIKDMRMLLTYDYIIVNDPFFIKDRNYHITNVGIYFAIVK